MYMATFCKFSSVLETSICFEIDELDNLYILIRPSSLILFLKLLIYLVIWG